MQSMRVLLLILLTGCIEVMGVPEKGEYTVRVDADGCPVPAPIVNDPNQPPLTLPPWCPYQVIQPDGTIITITPVGGKTVPPTPVPPPTEGQ